MTGVVLFGFEKMQQTSYQFALKYLFNYPLIYLFSHLFIIIFNLLQNINNLCIIVMCACLYVGGGPLLMLRELVTHTHCCNYLGIKYV